MILSAPSQDGVLSELQPHVDTVLETQHILNRSRLHGRDCLLSKALSGTVILRKAFFEYHTYYVHTVCKTGDVKIKMHSLYL